MIAKRKPGMKLAEALKALGLEDKNLACRSVEDFDLIHRHWKTEMILARGKDDGERQRELSAVNQYFKRLEARSRMRCAVCQQPCNGRHCTVHDQRKNANQSLKQIGIAGISDDILIPIPRKETELEKQIRGLILVGQSFQITNTLAKTIYNSAERLGVEIITRVLNRHEPDQKKWIFRIWRSDGLTMNQVNEAIQKRKAEKN